MIIKTFTLGPFEVNTYVLSCEETKNAAIIDYGGYDFANIENYLLENALSLNFILLTHGHLDHVTGVNELQKLKNIPIYMSKDDKFLLDILEQQLELYGMPPAKPPKEVMFVKDNEILNLGNIEIQVISTPGHSPGSVCYYIPHEKTLFAGDTIFSGSIGRTDLPGGSYDAIISSIREKILSLPDDTIIYSGHEESSSVGKEKKSNPYVGINAI